MVLTAGAVGLTLLGLFGYEKARPPSPDGRKKIEARTAKNTIHTRLEARSQPEKVRAGQVSIWDLKVFQPKDKPDGTREEWKFYAPLANASLSGNVSQVFMRAWLISADKRVFLPQIPSYKGYGSFVTDWTIPQNGAMTLWVEYTPIKLVRDGLPGGEILTTELARWNFQVAGEKKPNFEPLPAPTKAPSGEEFFPAMSLDRATYGAKSPFGIMLRRENFRANQSGGLDWSVTGIGENVEVETEDFAAISPNGQTFFHESSDTVAATFNAPGIWKCWFSFQIDGKKYGAPVDFLVK